MSMNLADIYGAQSAAGGVAVQPTSVGGPNQGSVATTAERPPMTSGSTTIGNSAAFSWVGFVGLLVAWRVLIESGAKL